jgi:hypothetical protein
MPKLVSRKNRDLIKNRREGYMRKYEKKILKIGKEGGEHAQRDRDRKANESFGSLAEFRTFGN